MKDWENICVTPTTTLEQALLVLDAQALKIALVVDDDRHLLGTLTDGDVRRALLAHRPLNGAVAEVMNRNPSVAGTDWSRDQIKVLMESRKLLQIPVVDAQGRVTGLHTLQSLIKVPRLDNPVFIMAGGFGTRLRPLTDHCPKPMLKVGDKPMLQIILEQFTRLGFHQFYISTHYLPEVIRDYFGDGSRWKAEIKYVHEENPLGTGGALSLLPRQEFDRPFFVINGDILTNLDFASLLKFHEKQGGVATMCTREIEQQVPYGVVQSGSQRLRQIVEKPVQQFQINAGIYMLDPSVLDAVTPQAKIDMPTLLQNQVANGLSVNIYAIRDYWLDIGRLGEYEKSQVDIKTLFD